MSDHLALRLNQSWAIHYDQHQWIICRARKLRSETKWQPRAYVGANKTTLARVTQEMGINIAPGAQSVLNTWPERFVDWLADIHAERIAA